MSSKWLSTNFADINALSERFKAGIEVHGTDLGLSSSEVSDFEATQTEYSADYLDFIQAELAYAIARSKLESDRDKVISLLRKFNNRMQSSENITNALRIEIGLPIHREPQRSRDPQKVDGFTVHPFANGTVKLKWSRSDANGYGTQFFVQTSVEGGPYTNFTMTLRESITLTGFAPGMPVAFRIIAAKESRLAHPSDTKWIYNSGGKDVSIELAA